jgi:hypothetical protein
VPAVCGRLPDELTGRRRSRVDGHLVLGGIAIWLAGEGVTNTGPMPRPEFGWAEFWLNRYQTSLAALIALAAAFAAARPAWKQLRELTRQSEQRTYEALRERAVSLNDEYLAMERVAASSDVAAREL